MFGLGDYDVNVLMIALDRYRVQANWVPAKTPLREVIEQNPNIKGFLVNVPSIFSLPSFMSSAQGWLGDRRHWVAVPKYCKYYYLVDSKAAPSRFEDQAALIRYLEKVQKESGHVLYLVGKSDSERPMR